MASAPKLSVIIPVYNEVVTIEEVLRRVAAVDIPKEVIVIDDGSTDGTRDVLDNLSSLYDVLLSHAENSGKGACIRTALPHARGEYVIFQDADLEYEPQEYALLMQPLEEDKADVVYGSRFWSGRPRRVLYYRHSLGNQFLTFISNLFTDLNVTDMMTCYKMMRRQALEGIQIEEDRFGVETELTGKLARQNLRFFEVGISYYGRRYEEGKKTGWRDGLRSIWCVLKYGRGRYKDIGAQTLHRLITFDEYNRHIFQQIKPHLGMRIMEIGSGIGSMAPLLLSYRKVILTDYNENYLRVLKNRYARHPNIDVRKYDILNHDPEVESLGVDTVICSNVMEHIEDDRMMLANFHHIVKPGGKVIILVPALKALYSDLDKNLEHYRRYSREELVEKMETAGFHLERVKYFNLVGSLGWFVAGRIFGASEIGNSHITIQKILMPISRLADRLTGPFMGLSLIAVGRREGVATEAESPAAAVASSDHR